MIDCDAIFRALAHPFRRKVLQWLADPAEYFSETERTPFRGVSAGMIHAQSGLSQSTVSGHLSQLERAGLLKANRLGQWVLLSRNDDAIHEFAERLCVDFARTATVFLFMDLAPQSHAQAAVLRRRARDSAEVSSCLRVPIFESERWCSITEAAVCPQPDLAR